MRYSTTYTQDGLALQAKRTAEGEENQSTPFLFAAVGAGTYEDDEPLSSRTALKDPKQVFGISSVSVVDETTVLVKFMVTNLPVNTPPGLPEDLTLPPITLPYDITEIGIYARDPDKGPILYALLLCNPDQRLDQMVPYSSADGTPDEINIQMNFRILVVNAGLAYIEPGMEAFALADDLVNMGERLEAHKADKDNPHEVIASQVPYSPAKGDDITVQAAIRILQDTVSDIEFVSKALDVPEQFGELEWTGDEQSPSMSYFNADKMTIDVNSITAATEPGEYPIRYTPKADYYWGDTGRADVREVIWKILPKKLTDEEVPALTTASQSLTYTGSEITPTWTGIDTDIMTLGGVTSATNAGTYTMTVTLDEHHAWPDGSTDTKSFEWTIGKAAGSLSLNKTSLSLNLSSYSGYIGVTRAGDGVITATSSNTDVATVAISGEQITVTGKGPGSATITVSVAAGANHTAPSSKTCSVTSSMPAIGTDTKAFTASDFKGIVNAGLTSKYLKPGDLTPLVPLNGTMGGVTFSNYKVRFKIMEVEDGHPFFLLWENESGTSICITPANYSSYIEANATGICMNRKGQVGTQTPDSTLDDNAKSWGPNKGGYKDTYCRNVLMPQFKALLPAEWRNIIIPTTIWTDNVGNATNAASNITATTDDCFLPDEYELFGRNAYGNSYCSQKQHQWAYPKAGNSLIAYKHDKPTEAAIWFERGPYRGAAHSFCGVYTRGGSSSLFAAYALGLRPAFRI